MQMSFEPRATDPNFQDVIKTALDPDIERKYIRGTELISFADAWDKCVERSNFLERSKGLVLGTPLPRKDFLKHTLVIGGTGSGKTLMLDFLQTQVNEQSHQYQDRMLVYDAKGETLSLLNALQVPVIINDPFDTRCKPWNIAADCQGADDAEKIAEILITSDENKDDAFFINSSRALVKGTILALMEIYPDHWDLRDLVLTLLTKNIEDLINILIQYEGNDYLVDRYLSNQEISSDKRVVNDPRLSQNVLASLAAKVEKYQIPAMLWHEAAKQNGTFTISEWLNSTESLVLGATSRARTVINSINRVLIRRIIDIIKDKENLSHNNIQGYTWFFLDELKEMGKVDGLNELLNFSRSKGVAVILGVHTVPGMKATYGDHEAEEILGLCRNKVVLRTDCPATAEYLSSLFGETEYLEIQRDLSITNSAGKSENNSEGITENEEEGTNQPAKERKATNDTVLTYSKGNGRSTERSLGDSREISAANSHTMSHVITKTVLPSEFLRLPDADVINGVSWFGICPESCYQAQRDLSFFTDSIPAKQSSRLPVKQSIKHTIKWSLFERTLIGLELNYPDNWNIDGSSHLTIIRKNLIGDLQKRIKRPLVFEAEKHLQKLQDWLAIMTEANRFILDEDQKNFQLLVARIKRDFTLLCVPKTSAESVWFQEVGKFAMGEREWNNLWDSHMPQ
jgi:Type IV secretion-system coupling protein DNA-binding domain